MAAGQHGLYRWGRACNHRGPPFPSQPEAPLRSTPSSLVSIVDGDPFVRAATRSLVRSIGLNARVFADATSFLDSGAPELTRCLVCGLTRSGIGGIELLARLEHRGLSIPTLFVCGRATAVLQRLIGSAPVLCLLETSLDASELEHWIRRALTRFFPPTGSESDARQRTQGAASGKITVARVPPCGRDANSS